MNASPKIFRSGIQRISWSWSGRTEINRSPAGRPLRRSLILKKKLTKYSDEIDDIFQRSIEDIIEELPKEDIAHKRLSLLIKLGLGYLTLERKTQTLSTGEFQCVHLVSELFAKTRNPHTLFIFDEPSKGLSQNILNQFIDSVRVILEDESVSIIMIEHNAYMLESSDYIVDFGKRQLTPVQHLDVVSHDDYYSHKNSDERVEPLHISSTLQVKNWYQLFTGKSSGLFQKRRERL